MIAVDWPWHGESDSPIPPLKAGAGLLADVLEDIVEALGLPAAVFIGDSVGGFAAARLAITNPERVAGLVLVNNGGFIPANLITRAFCKLMGTPAITRLLLPGFTRLAVRPASDNDREIVRRVTTRLRTREGTSTAAALWRSFARDEHDLRPRAAHLRAPTLIVWGTKDLGLPLRVGRATHAAITGSRLETLATGHIAFSSDPGRFLSLIGPFIESVVQTTASPEMLAIASARISDERVRFVQADLFTWTPDRRYDVVFIGFWLSHVPLERFASFWSLAADCLQEDGRVFFVDDAYRAPDELVEGPSSSTIRRRVDDGTPYRLVKVAHTPPELQERLRRLGWDITVTATSGPFYWGAGTRPRRL